MLGNLRYDTTNELIIECLKSQESVTLYEESVRKHSIMISLSKCGKGYCYSITIKTDKEKIFDSVYKSIKKKPVSLVIEAIFKVYSITFNKPSFDFFNGLFANTAAEMLF